MAKDLEGHIKTSHSEWRSRQIVTLQDIRASLKNSPDVDLGLAAERVDKAPIKRKATLQSVKRLMREQKKQRLLTSQPHRRRKGQTNIQFVV